MFNVALQYLELKFLVKQPKNKESIILKKDNTKQ